MGNWLIFQIKNFWNWNFFSVLAGNSDCIGIGKYRDWYGSRQHIGLCRGMSREEATTSLQLSPCQFGGEWSLRCTSRHADGTVVRDTRHVVLRADNVRPLGEFRCPLLHRKHSKPLHDIRRQVSEIQLNTWKPHC